MISASRQNMHRSSTINSYSKIEEIDGDIDKDKELDSNTLDIIKNISIYLKENGLVSAFDTVLRICIKIKHYFRSACLSSEILYLALFMTRRKSKISILYT